MNFQETSLVCCDCEAAFVFTAREQEFYHSKGFVNEPKRCPACRHARKTERSGSTDFGSFRRAYSAVCGECGKETQVPFQPRGDRPVFCSDCYHKVKRGH